MFNEGCMACLAPRYLNLYNHFEKDRNERQKREREEGITRIVYIAVGAQTWPVGSGFRSGCGRGEREMWPGFENRIPRPPHKHEAWGEWGAGAWKRATCAKWAPRGGRGARDSGYALWLCLQRLKMGPTVVLPDGDPV